jgi:DNA-binding beta-propeller fold protein YncE
MKPWYGVLALLLLCAGVQATSGASYAFVTKWGSEGTGENQFEWPTGVAVDADGYVYVSDYQNDRCAKFTSTGTYISTPVDGSNGYMSSVAVDSRGFLYLTFVDLVFGDDVDNRPPGDIYVYSDWGWYIDQGSWTRCAAIGEDCTHYYYLDRPSSVAVKPNEVLPFHSVYVTDLVKDCVAMFAFDYDSNQITFVRSWGQAGSLIGQFRDPEGIAVAPDGTLYVADTGNHRVQKFHADGTFVSKWGRNGGDGTAGTGDGEFNRPKGVAVDAAGNVFVTDSDNHRVQKFTADGTFLTKWGSEGTGDGQFRNPRGIAVDAAGNVYVADQLNNRIQKFGRVVQAIPVGAGALPRMPTDTESNGVYDDVNGNLRRDFADVVLYFNRMDWIAANEPVPAFDFNGNGRIDFADVVWLFNNL